MSGINVIDADGERQCFPDATTWHIDDRGQLHLGGADGPVASFAKDRWQSAGTDEATPALMPDNPVTSELLVELKRCRKAVERAVSVQTKPGRSA